MACYQGCGEIIFLRENLFVTFVKTLILYKTKRKHLPKTFLQHKM